MHRATGARQNWINCRNAHLSCRDENLFKQAENGEPGALTNQRNASTHCVNKESMTRDMLITDTLKCFLAEIRC